MEDHIWDLMDEERYQISAEHDRWDGYGDGDRDDRNDEWDELFIGPVQIPDWVAWMYFLDNWKAIGAHLAGWDDLPF